MSQSMDNVLQDVLDMMRSQTYSQEDVVNCLQMLKLQLSTCEESQNTLQTLNCLLGPVLQALPVHNLEHDLLLFTLPATKEFFIKCLSSICDTLRTSTTSGLDGVICNKLEECIEVLNCVDSMLTYLNGLDKLEASCISSVPKNTASIILEAFQHCKNSEKEYKDVFSSVRGHLISFFQKTHHIQVNLFTLLNNNVIFSCSLEDDISLLCEVLEILSCIGEIVVSLDTKSMVEQWKGYARLIQAYAEYLRPRLNVSRPIQFLSENIQNTLLNIPSLIQQDEKLIMKNIKMSSLELKVVIRICEHYRDYLGDCHKQLVNLLVQLNIYSSGYLCLKGVPAALSGDIERQVTAGAVPLVGYLLADRAFVEEYKTAVSQLNGSDIEQSFGLLLLTISVIKKLQSSDKNIQRLWMNKSFSIFNSVFILLAKGNAALCLFSESEHFIDIYQSMLTSISALIVSAVEQDMFADLGKVLFAQLLQPLMWPAMFSSDLFCLIGRLGTSDLCLDLCTQLCTIMIKFKQCDHVLPEWIYITQTAARLFPLLSSSGKHAFVLQFPPIHQNLLWSYLPMSQLPQQERESCIHGLVTKIITSIRHFLDSEPSVTNYQNMLVCLNMVGNCTRLSSENDVTVYKPLYESVRSLWQCILLPSGLSKRESSVKGSQWFYNFLCALIDATLPLLKFFSNSDLLDMMTCVIDVSKTGASVCRSAAIKLLHSLATVTVNTDHNQKKVFYQISSLFAILLQDSDPLVKQSALEVFAYFAYITKHEQIVADVVGDDDDLQTVVTKYLQRLPISSTNTGLETYLMSLDYKFIHKCSKLERSSDSNDEFDPNFMNEVLDEYIAGVSDVNPTKKLKTEMSSESSAVSALQRIEQNCSRVTDYFKQNTVTPAVREKLVSVFRKMENLREFL